MPARQLLMRTIYNVKKWDYVSSQQLTSLPRLKLIGVYGFHAQSQDASESNYVIIMVAQNQATVTFMFRQTFKFRLHNLLEYGAESDFPG